MSPKIRIGIVGAGFIGRGSSLAISRHPDFQVSKVLTRRSVENSEFPLPGCLTNSFEDLIRSSDIIVECTGDVVYATQVISDVLESDIPVVTMNSEVQVTTGSWLLRRGYLTEAEGDQPGSIASLAENAIDMGFEPVLYGNIKRFLNHEPTEAEMIYWSEKNGISIKQTTSFTDGTKLQIEQALVANGLGAEIFSGGMEGVETDSLQEGADLICEKASLLNVPVSDYILSRKLPSGVFIAATHSQEQSPSLRYLKMGVGPYYVLLQPNHLCHLEIPKTLKRVVAGGKPLLTNSPMPRYGVVAVAKRDLEIGDKIGTGIGSFQARGMAVSMKTHRNAVPIGLLNDAVVAKQVQKNEIIDFSSVELPESLAFRAYREILDGITAP